VLRLNEPPFRKRLLLVLAALLLVSACSAGADEEGAATPVAISISQSDGRLLELAAPPERIVSLASHATEIICAIGAGDRLVAVDRHANCPLEGGSKPAVDSFQPSIEAIVAFEPDLVYVFSDQGGVVEALRQTGTPVLYLKSPATLAGVFENIALLGAVTDRAPAARALIAALEERRDAIRLRVEDVAQGPRFFHEISPDYYTARDDTFVGGLYALLKGENVAAGAASTYPQLSAEVIVERDPEVIILVDGVEATAVGERPGWGGVSAVRDGRICEVDPDLVSRPGPRIIDGLEALADCLYPEAD